MRTKKKDTKKPEETAKIANEDLPFKKGFLRDWFEVIMYGLAIFMFLKGFVFQNFQIPTSSMENTLLIGDHLTANKFVYAPYQWEWEKSILPLKDVERGDVVVFKFPLKITDDYIKRCVGLPGDRFEIINHKIYVNGQPVPENYTYYKSVNMSGSGKRDPDNENYPLDYETQKPGLEEASYIQRQFKPIDSHEEKDMTHLKLLPLLNRTMKTLRYLDPEAGPHYQQWMEKLRTSDGFVIPDGFYLMMGDNRNNSADSRIWGLVPKALIEGRAYCVWWSYGEETGTHQLSGFELIYSYIRVAWRIFTHTHWERCFHIID